MKKNFTLILICLTLISKADYWTQKADFPGLNRDMCFNFTIGDKGYVGCGRDSALVLENSFWEYDKPSNTWTQKANFAGGLRYSATGFALLNKGYACFGENNTGTYQNDVWEYDPTSNNWMQKLNFTGGARVQAASLIIQNKAYICCGLMQGGPIYYNDLWEYDSVNDNWAQKASLPASARISPIAFSLSGKGYIGAGYFYNGMFNYLQDFWQYDPITNNWFQKATFAGTGRTQVASFALFNNGFTGTGADLSGYLNDFWQYNPVSDQWIQKTNVPGPNRNECISFSIGNNGYAGMGEATFNYPNDFWEYTPDSTTGISDLGFMISDFVVYPNPAKEFLVCCFRFPLQNKIDLNITDIQGKKIYSQQLETKIQKPEAKIDLRQFSKGIYFVEVTDGKQKMVKKFLKE